MFKRIVLAMALALSLLAATPARTSAADAAHTPAVEQASGHGESAEAGEHKPSLLPDPMARDTQLHALWVIIIFVVLLVILYPTAWKQVLAGLKTREERIRKDIADAEAARAKAEATLKEYAAQLATAEAKVREMIAAATAQGEKMASEIQARAQKEALDTKNRAMQDIEAAGKQAVRDIYEKAAELSTSIASKILRRNINADDQRDLVQRGIEEFQTVEK